MKRLALLLSTALVLAAFVLPLSAMATTFTTDRTSFEAALVDFADVDLSGFSAFDTISAGTGIALPGTYGSLAFDSDLSVRQVPTSWATWSGGKTPTVLFTLGETSVSGTFAPGVYAFGLEMEPNPFSTLGMTLLLSDGSSLTQAVAGSSGAKFFGFVSDMTISAITLSSAADFAFGEMVVGSPVPEPSTLLLLGGGLLGLGYFGRKRMKG